MTSKPPASIPEKASTLATGKGIPGIDPKLPTHTPPASYDVLSSGKTRPVQVAKWPPMPGGVPLPKGGVGGVWRGAFEVASAYTALNLERQRFANIIRLGTFCRVVLWPVIPLVGLFHYIRQRDRDWYALELLRSRCKSEDCAAFYDWTMPGASGHWRMQNDLEIIRRAANVED
ncbi:hypothetical protein FOZ61_006085 [Perkinsus olseni]|uniref:Uncharacterized protein n=1 Tax=Perkinsus olseni TaxID=32597 RepID=A0A7J6MRB1_PEROL|nr:hypothetical protein FOZ61_006085 [Perkinsus olseni]KAF4674092.1 hypothetical protein FOL46_005796 [Perkinsus olseni]KAF4748599.1 hypothetical protein FOZ63_024039 [Perkinsus olseni]KAF4752351.1 hypothetical protein FOZ62_000696 [Perkinsus olseni]